MIAIASRLEPFVDHYLIDQLDNTRLTLHRPVSANTALTLDKPWEGAFCGYMTVLQHDGRYLLYYRGWPSVEKGSEGYYCIAESTDGVAFTRLKLDQHEVFNARDNNVFLKGGRTTHNFSPFIDTRPGIPDNQRFKALADCHYDDNKRGLQAWASPDGIQWALMQEPPVITQGAFDSQNVAFWSEHEGCYVSYYRTFHGGKDPTVMTSKLFRTISRATSDDFLNWSHPIEMTYGDTPQEHLYTNQTHPYFRAPHIYIATPKRFVPNRQRHSDEDAARMQIIAPYHKDVSDAVFMTTRGGNRYDRTFMEAFVRPGEDQRNWVSRTNMAALNIVPTGKREMSLYVQHRYAHATQYVQRYTLRTDGFASVNAPYAGGTMTTNSLTFTGAKLVLNYATSAPGSIRVELRDQANKPIKGHTLADCDEIFGDDIARPVTWKESSDLSAHAGRPVRLHFAMKDADLYAIQFPV